MKSSGESILSYDNSKTKISVALATYNGSQYIEKQLTSILNQIRKPDEVIISDDNSNDDTQKKINEFITKNQLNSWKLIINKGKGVVSNFNNALKNVTGDIIILCDQDDIWFDNKLLEIDMCFRKNAEILALNTSFQYIDELDNNIEIKIKKGTSNNNLILHSIPKDEIEKIPLNLVIFKNISPGMTMAVRREILKIYLENANKRNLHDYELNCIAALFNGLYFYNKKLTYYRIHKNQTVSIGNIKKRRKKDILINKIKEESVRIKSLLDISDTLRECNINNFNRYYLQKLNKWLSIRKKVVLDKNKKYIFKDLYYFIYFKIKYKHINVIYFIIDFLSSFIKKERTNLNNAN